MSPSQLVARDIFYAGPPGTVPDFNAPNPIGTFLVAINIPFLAIAGVLVVARIYTRTFLTRSLGWDDYLIVASLLSAIVWCVSVCLEVQHGLGQYAYNVSKDDDNLTPLFKLDYTKEIANYFSLLESKSSILIMYLRTFATTRKLKLSYYAALFVVVVSHLSFIIVNTISLWPIDCRWTPIDCTVIAQDGPAILFISAMSIILDIYLVAVGIYIVNQLKLSYKRKLSLCAVISFGLAVTAVSTYRMYILAYTGYVSTDPDTTQDITHSSVDWASGMEIYLSIVCACLPTLRLFFIGIFQKTSSILSGSGSSNKRTTGVSAFKSDKSGKSGGSHPETWQHQSGVPPPSSSYMELTTASQKSSEGVITEEMEV